MNVRTVRRGVVTLLGWIAAWLIPCAASAGITLTPAAPTAADNIQIGVTWDVPTPCYASTYTYTISNNVIRVEITDADATPPGVVCAFVIQPRSIVVPVGLLAPGSYTVEVYNRIVPRLSPPPAFTLLFTTTFRVTPTGAPPPSATITISPAHPTTTDDVAITAAWNTSPCSTISSTHTVSSGAIRIDVTETPPPVGTICTAVIVTRSVTESVGTLAAGTYAVSVYHNGALTGTSSFDVTASDVVVVPLSAQRMALRVNPLPPSSQSVDVGVAWLVPTTGCFNESHAGSLSGNSLRVEVTVVAASTNCLSANQWHGFYVPTGEPPAGSYQATVYFNGSPGLSREFTVAPDVVPTDTVLTVVNLNGQAQLLSTDRAIFRLQTSVPTTCFSIAGGRGEVSGTTIRLDYSIIRTALDYYPDFTVPCLNETRRIDDVMGRVTLDPLAAGTYSVQVFFNGVLNLTQELTISPVADLAVTQTVSPNPVKRDRLVLYRIDATNNGPDAAGGTTANTTLPANLSLVTVSASQGGCTVSNQRTVTCALGSVNSGATATVSILAKARSTGSPTLSATVSADAVDPNGTNNSASTVLRIRK